MIKEGADKNKTGDYGKNALHLAARNGHVEVVKYLVDEQSFNVNSTDEYKRTALIIAASCGHFEVVKALLERKADPNLKDGNGYDAYKWAKKDGYTAIAN